MSESYDEESVPELPVATQSQKPPSPANCHGIGEPREITRRGEGGAEYRKRYDDNEWKLMRMKESLTGEPCINSPSTAKRHRIARPLKADEQLREEEATLPKRQ